MTEDLLKHACLRLVSSSFSPCWKLDNGDEQYASEPFGSLSGNSTEALLDTARRGLGILMLPAFSVVDDLRRGTLTLVLPAWRSPEISIFALLPSGRYVDAKTRGRIDMLKEQLPTLGERDMAFFAASTTDEPTSMARRFRPSSSKNGT